MLKNENGDLKKSIENSEYEKEKIEEEKNHKLNLLNTTYIDKIRKLDVNIDGLENTLRQIKGKLINLNFLEALAHKDQECNNHIELR